MAADHPMSVHVHVYTIIVQRELIIKQLSKFGWEKLHKESS